MLFRNWGDSTVDRGKDPKIRSKLVFRANYIEVEAECGDLATPLAIGAVDHRYDLLDRYLHFVVASIL